MASKVDGLFDSKKNPKNLPTFLNKMPNSLEKVPNQKPKYPKCNTKVFKRKRTKKPTNCQKFLNKFHTIFYKDQVKCSSFA